MEKLFKKLTAKNLTTRLALLVVANATSSISLPAANFANPKVDGLIHRQWRRIGAGLDDDAGSTASTSTTTPGPGTAVVVGSGAGVSAAV